MQIVHGRSPVKTGGAPVVLKLCGRAAAIGRQSGDANPVLGNMCDPAVLPQSAREPLGRPQGEAAAAAAAATGHRLEQARQWGLAGLPRGSPDAHAARHAARARVRAKRAICGREGSGEGA